MTADGFDPPQSLCEGKFLRLVKRGRWEFTECTNTKGAAVIAALTDDHKVLLIEQPRASLGRPVIELPAGSVGDEAAHAGEAFIAAARRELREETGYDARHIGPVVTGVPSAGLSNEIVTIFIATGLTKVSDTLGDGAEQITLHEVPLAQIDQWLESRIAQGAIVDVKIYAGLYFLQRSRQVV